MLVTTNDAPLRGGWKRRFTEAAMNVMGRRIPTTVPEYSEARAAEVIDKLEIGDVVLTCDCAFPGWARVEYWTVQADYTHAAVYGGDGKIYEATGAGVKGADLDTYFKGRLKVAVVRPPYAKPEDAQAAVDYCKSVVGTPYDGLADLEDDSEIACTELVYKALRSGSTPLLAPTHMILGQEVVGPDAFMKIPGSEIVHDDKSDYWLNKLGHWPLAGATLAGGVAGGYVGGTVGAVAGLMTGLVGSVLIGNKIQTGEFWP